MNNIPGTYKIQNTKQETAMGTRRSETPAYNRTMPSLTAFILYIGLILIPNPLLFNIRVRGNLAITPVRLILLILVVFLLLDITGGKNRTRPFKIDYELLLPVCALLILKVFSLLYSQNISVGVQMIEWYSEVSLLSFIYFYYYRNGTIQFNGTVLCLITGFVISLFASILQISSSHYQITLLQGITEYVLKVSAHPDVSRIPGLFSLDANVYACYISSMIMLILFAIMLSREWRMYMLLFPILGLGIFVLTSTQSFTGVIVLSIAIIVFIIIERAYKSFMVLLTFAGLFIIIVFVMLLLQGSVANYLDKVAYRYRDSYRTLSNPYYPDKYLSDAVNAHLEMQKQYVGFINNNPLRLILGCGEGGYSSETQGNASVTTAHNAYLLVLAENGVLGLLLLLYISWKILRTSYALNKRSDNYLEKSFFYICLIFVLSMLIYGSSFLHPFFWLIVGLTFGAAKREPLGV